MIQTLAPAKINLYLHVTGRREDGYHYLDSLVAFAAVGDRITLVPAETFSFVLDGPLAGPLACFPAEDNLAVRAVRALGARLGRQADFTLTLTKNVPMASGIGGGSADAAAALRAAAAHWACEDGALLEDIAAQVGQDVPSCLLSRPCYFEGIGDRTSCAPDMPYGDLLLVNPGVPLATPLVFKSRQGAFGDPAPRLATAPATLGALVEYLAATRNDLTQAALSLCPPVGDVLTALAACEGVLLSRMSGSGATCFGLFADRGAARKAAAKLHEEHPDWWVVQTFLALDSPPCSSS